MRVDAGRSKLYSALKALQEQWEPVRDQWHDAVRVEFEEQILEPLIQHSREALQAIDRLGQLFMQLREECEAMP